MIIRVKSKKTFTIHLKILAIAYSVNSIRNVMAKKIQFL